MKKAPEYNRLKIGSLASDSSYYNNGFFVFDHYRIFRYEIRCMISDGMGWEHVSVTIAEIDKDATRCPTWEEMCWVKNKFWNVNECVIQYHPVEEDYISCHNFCLHLWKPIGIDIPKPDPKMVG
jgi:hypothetical protein